MRKLNRLLLFACLCVTFNLSATGDSISYLLRTDTVLMVRDQWNDKYMLHTMAPGQTLYGLAEHYGLEMEDLFQFNDGLSIESYGVGTQVQIPVPNFAIMRYATDNIDLRFAAPIYYVVRPGDTMYGLTRRVFNMPESIMMARNDLNDPTLSIGQKLFVGWIRTGGISKKNRNYIGRTPQERLSYSLRSKYRRKLGDREERVEKGMARWIGGEKQRFYILHRRAKKGSIVRIHSTLNNKTYYVEVVGTVPDSRYSSDVKVVLSEALARALGAVDSRLYVTLGFY